jgi:RNA polymerase sigma-70 factor, ECF subfamily
MPSAAAEIGDSSLDDKVRQALECPSLQSALFAHAMAKLGKSLKGQPRSTREESARDACQQAVVIALKKRSQFDGVRNVSAWVHGILDNVVRDSVRKLCKQPAQAPDDPESWEKLATSLDANEQPVERSDLAPILAALTADEREMIEMRYLQQLGHDAIARRFGISVGCARVRLSRALNRLRTLVPTQSGKEGGR